MQGTLPTVWLQDRAVAPDDRFGGANVQFLGLAAATATAAAVFIQIVASNINDPRRDRVRRHRHHAGTNADRSLASISAMDQQAANLLSALRRSSSSPESKLTLLNSLKSDIKHYRVPENAQVALFDCLKLAISQQTSNSITAAAFSTLNHLVKRLKIQDPDGKSISAYGPRLLPALSERLGDHRDGHRSGASQSLMDLWPYCTQDVEHVIREDSINGSHVRAKEEGMQWVVKMNQDAQLPFKSFVPSMVACLEYSDGGVRDAAKTAIVELFR